MLPGGTVARFLGVAALLALSPSALAQSEDAALDALHKGQLLLEQGALNGAREQFAEAARLAPNKANPYFYLAVVDSKLNRCPDVLLDLEYYFKLAPAGHAHVAEATSMRDHCREVVKPKFGTLAIETEPPGTEVRLDDSASALRGVTPWRDAAVPAGDHLIYLTHTGFVPESRSVTVPIDREAVLRVELKPLASPISTAPEKVDNLSVQANQVNINSSDTRASEPPRKKPRYWIAGVVFGVVAAAALGIGLGVGLSGGGSAMKIDPVGAVR